jgi:hypothetical protein
MGVWDHLYKTARWQRLRRLQLQAHPLCKFCLSRGIVTAATVVDHVIPHRGNWKAFVTGELLSLCAPCHNCVKQQIETRGYFNDIGIDGFPIDPNHPFNRTRKAAAAPGTGPQARHTRRPGILRARLGRLRPEPLARGKSTIGSLSQLRPEHAQSSGLLRCDSLSLLIFGGSKFSLDSSGLLKPKTAWLLSLMR